MNLDAPDTVALLDDFGMKPPEVTAVDLDGPLGPVVSVKDGTKYLRCAVADGDGKTGWMFLEAPTENYTGSYPVYAPPVDDQVLEVDPDSEIPGTVEERPDGPDLGVNLDEAPTRAHDLIDWIGDDPARAAAVRAIEAERDKPRTTVLGHIADVIGDDDDEA